MSNLKELSELAWQGELDTKFEHHPVHTFYEGSTELDENLLGRSEEHTSELQSHS